MFALLTLAFQGCICLELDLSDKNILSHITPEKRRQLVHMQKLNGHQLTGYRADDKREFVDVRIGAENCVVPCPQGVAGFQQSILRLSHLLNRVSFPF